MPLRVLKPCFKVVSLNLHRNQDELSSGRLYDQLREYRLEQLRLIQYDRLTANEC